jgi:hypothetical protein
MGIFHEYGTDKAAEQDGVWSDEFRGDVRMKIRSMQSKAVRAAHERVNKRNTRYFKTGATIPVDVVEKNEIDLAVAIVAAWDGADMVDRAGQPLVCDDATKAEVFAKLHELRQQVIGMANTNELFREQEVREAAGNSPAASAPSAS